VDAAEAAHRGYREMRDGRTAVNARGYNQAERASKHAFLRNEPDWFWLENSGYLSELE